MYHVKECRITTSTAALTFQGFLLEEQEETAGKRKVRVSLLQSLPHHLHKDEQKMEAEGRENKIFISLIFFLCFWVAVVVVFQRKRTRNNIFLSLEVDSGSS